MYENKQIYAYSQIVVIKMRGIFDSDDIRLQKLSGPTSQVASLTSHQLSYLCIPYPTLVLLLLPCQLSQPEMAQGSQCTVMGRYYGVIQIKGGSDVMLIIIKYL